MQVAGIAATFVWLGMVLASALAGHLVSSGLGERLLHDEIESQLSRLLEPATV